MKISIIIGLLLNLFCCSYTQAQPNENTQPKKEILVGQRFPDFAVQEWLGKEPEFKGKFVLVDFWCIMAYPVTHRTVPYQNYLAKKYEEYLQVVGLTCDEANLVKLMVEPDIRYHRGIVDASIIEDIFDIQAWPVTYLIDPDGIIVWKGHVLKEGVGEKNTFNLTEDVLENLFNEYQKKKETEKSNSQESTEFDWSRPMLGKKAPVLNVKEWITEKPDMAGKFIVLDFWATFCGPCVKFTPNMNEFFKKFKQEAVFIAIATQSKESMEEGLEQIKKAKKERKEEYTPIMFYQATDPKYELFNQYLSDAIPLVIIIDPDGIVRWQGNPHGERGDGEGGLTEEVIRDIIVKHKKK